MSLRLMSSSLCSVALETVTPPTWTGSSSAHGLSAPVRPTRMWIFVSVVTAGHRRPLERARPARPLVQRAEPPLLVERVDLDHDPVDLVVELGAPRLPRDARARRPPRSISSRSRMRVRAEAALAQPLERLPLRPRLGAFARRRCRRPRSTSGRSAVIAGFICRSEPAAALRGFGAGFLPGRELRLVEAREAGEREVDLAAHLEQRRRRSPRRSIRSGIASIVRRLPSRPRRARRRRASRRGRARPSS